MSSQDWEFYTSIFVFMVWVIIAWLYFSRVVGVIFSFLANKMMRFFGIGIVIGFPFSLNENIWKIITVFSWFLSDMFLIFLWPMRRKVAPILIYFIAQISWVRISGAKVTFTMGKIQERIDRDRVTKVLYTVKTCSLLNTVSIIGSVENLKTTVLWAG